MNILLSKFAGSSKIWLIVCGTHGGCCWFDINISIHTHQIFVNLVSVKRGGINLFRNVKKLQKFGLFI